MSLGSNKGSHARPSPPVCPGKSCKRAPEKHGKMCRSKASNKKACCCQRMHTKDAKRSAAANAMHPRTAPRSFNHTNLPIIKVFDDSVLSNVFVLAKWVLPRKPVSVPRSVAATGRHFLWDIAETTLSRRATIPSCEHSDLNVRLWPAGCQPCWLKAKNKNGTMSSVAGAGDGNVFFGILQSDHFARSQKSPTRTNSLECESLFFERHALSTQSW